MTSQASKIRIAGVISSELAMRKSADDFFDYLERIASESVEVDFSGVRSISRSFAHEYLLRKQASTKQITEKNVPSNVVKMMEVIRNPSPRESIFSSAPVRLVDV